MKEASAFPGERNNRPRNLHGTGAPRLPSDVSFKRIGDLVKEKALIASKGKV